MNTQFWETKKLEEIVDFIADNRGKNPPSFSNSGIPVIDNFQITGDRFVNLGDSKRFINDDIYNGFIRDHIQASDLLITLVGNGYGNVALAPKRKSAIIQNTIGLRCGTSCRNEFLYYFFKLNKQRITNRNRGAAQPSIKLGDLLSIKLALPALNTQDKIISVLSAHDDLIENNEKRIKVLEEMAQRLYTEWFVNFKFPGHKDFKFIDSPMGKVPAEWLEQSIDDVAKIVRGTSYSSEDIDDTDGDYYLVNLKSFNRGGGFRFDGVKFFNGAIKEEQLLKPGDIVVAVTDMTTDRAVISRPARIPNIRNQKITFSADVVKIVPQKIPPAYTYYSLLDYRFTETTKNKANGANVLHLKPAAISEYRILIPGKDLLDEFENKCLNILELKDNLSEKNEKLRKIRDLLIPQLVTGRRMLKNG